MQRLLLAGIGIGWVAWFAPAQAQTAFEAQLQREFLNLLRSHQGTTQLPGLLEQLLDQLPAELGQRDSLAEEAAILSLVNARFLRPCLSALLAPVSARSSQCSLGITPTPARPSQPQLRLQELLNSGLPTWQNRPGFNPWPSATSGSGFGGSLPVPRLPTSRQFSTRSIPFPLPGIPSPPTPQTVPIPVRPWF